MAQGWHPLTGSRLHRRFSEFQRPCILAHPSMITSESGLRHPAKPLQPGFGPAQIPSRQLLRHRQLSQGLAHKSQPARKCVGRIFASLGPLVLAFFCFPILGLSVRHRRITLLLQSILLLVQSNRLTQPAQHITRAESRQPK